MDYDSGFTLSKYTKVFYYRVLYNPVNYWSTIFNHLIYCGENMLWNTFNNIVFYHVIIVIGFGKEIFFSNVGIMQENVGITIWEDKLVITCGKFKFGTFTDKPWQINYGSKWDLVWFQIETNIVALSEIICTLF